MKANSANHRSRSASRSASRPPRRVALALAALVALVALALLVVACGGTVKRPDGGVGLLPVGSTAPDVAGEGPAGEQVRLSQLRGKPVVVYFYPKDDTPGCTKEACAFRDAWKSYESAGVAVLGVSNDSAASHREFQKKHTLPFPLVADESGAVAASYGVSKKLFGYERVTFLVGKDGRVAHVWPDVDPGVHARDVLAEVQKLP